MSQGLRIAIIIVAALVAVAALVVASLFLWRRTVRHHVVTLIGKRAGVEAAFATVEGLVGTLARASDGELVALALNPAAEERKTLEEVAEQMEILADELATMPLPKRLWDAANELSDAASELWRQTSRLTGKEGIDALDALGELDLVRVQTHVDAGGALLGELAGRYDVGDAAVYGGGLYI